MAADTIPVGDSATFTYTVSNDGDAPLTSITLTDAWGAVPGAPSSLAVGSSAQVQRVVSPASSVDNTVTVNAVGPGDVETEMMEIEWVQEGDRRSISPVEVKEEYRQRLILERLERPQESPSSVLRVDQSPVL